MTLQLYRLTNTDIVALEKEHGELEAKINDLRNILDNHDALLNVIKDELKKFVHALNRTSITY